ncbi:MAG: dienelactone hydrolase family protein, partial [Myxococcota bacterium]
MRTDDSLTDFDAREIAVASTTKRVYVAGTGPAVIVIHEMPGISPDVARFARWVRSAGYTVYLPSLFGRDCAVPGLEGVGVGLRHQLAEPRVRQRLVAEQFERGELFGPTRRGAGRHRHRHIPMQHAGGVADRGDPFEFLFQLVIG